MAKVSINNLLHLSRRSFSVTVTDNMRKAAEATTESKAADFGSAEAATEQKEIFWMRDPKSGNWIPESHLGEIDIVDLREKLLSRQKKLM